MVLSYFFRKRCGLCEDRKNPGDEPNIDIVVFVGLGTRTKGKGNGMTEETDVLNSLQRKL